MANNFKVWAEDNDKLLSPGEFGAASKNGFKAGDLLSAQKINTILRQNSLMSAALEEWLAQHSQNIDIDTDMLDIAQSLGKSWKSQDIINVTIYEDMWQPIDKTDLGGAGNGYGGSMAYKYEILLDNFSPYDLYIIGAPSSIAQTSFSDGKASTRAMSYDETYQFITFALATNIGITLYATEKPYTAIIPIHILYNINTNTIPGPCFLSHQPKNSQYVHESSKEGSNGYTYYVHHLCNHARMQREITIAPTETKFGRLDEICIDCTYHKSYFIIPTKTDNSPIFPNCKHNCTGFLSTGLFTHVEYCFDCCTLMAPEKNHSIVWRSNENSHWSECDKCHDVISQKQKHSDSGRWIPIPSKEESGHGKQCSICQHIIPSTVASHSKGSTCSECSYTHEHDYTLPYGYPSSIANYHYLNAVCSICGERREDYNNEDAKQAHEWITKIYPKEDSRNESQQHTRLVTCKICGEENESQRKTETHTWRAYPEKSLMPINSQFHANICGVTNRTQPITAMCCGTAHDELYNKTGVSELGEIKYCTKFGEKIIIEPTDDIPLACEGELNSDKILNNKIIDIRKIPHRLSYKSSTYASDGCGFMANMAPHYIYQWVNSEDGTNQKVPKCICGLILSTEFCQHKNNEGKSTIDKSSRDCTKFVCTVCGKSDFYNEHDFNGVTNYNLECGSGEHKCLNAGCNVSITADAAHSKTSAELPCGTSEICGHSVDVNNITYTCQKVITSEYDSHEEPDGWESDLYGNYHYKKCLKCNDILEQASHNMEVTNYDTNTHTLKCSDCDYKRYEEDHRWRVIYESWDDTGHDETCASCPATRESVEHDKIYVKLDNNDTQHKIECNKPLCHWSVKEDHNFTSYSYVNGGTTHTKKCVCGYEKIEDHSFTWEQDDDTYHTKKCVCGYAITEEHGDYTPAYNDLSHWYKCGKCGKDMPGEDNHTNTDNSDVPCEVCGYIKQ